MLSACLHCVTNTNLQLLLCVTPERMTVPLTRLCVENKRHCSCFSYFILFFFFATSVRDVDINFITLDLKHLDSYWGSVRCDERRRTSFLVFCHCDVFFTSLLTFRPKAKFSLFIKMEHKAIVV